MAFTGQFIGNVGRDPELRAFESGKMVTEIAVAVKQRGKKGPDGQWVDQPSFWTKVELWNRQAEVACDTIRKGDRVYVTGQIEQEVYQKRDGSEGRALKIVYGSIEKLDREAPAAAAPAPVARAAQVVVTAPDSDGIPF